MEKQTEKEYQIIDQVLSLLEEKHGRLPIERYCYYVVKGEYEEECDSEDYCEECINKGVRNHIDKWLQKRGLEMGRVRQLETTGYIIYIGWNKENDCRAVQIQIPDPDDAKRYIHDVYEKYREEPKPIFSFRYYQRDSDTTTRNCNNCAKIIEVCVTADEQEIEHWESLTDPDLIVINMDDYTAYQLYEILQFIHQAEDEVYRRGVALAEKILELNKMKPEDLDKIMNNGDR